MTCQRVLVHGMFVSVLFLPAAPAFADWLSLGASYGHFLPTELTGQADDGPSGMGGTLDFNFTKHWGLEFGYQAADTSASYSTSHSATDIANGVPHNDTNVSIGFRGPVVFLLGTLPMRYDTGLTAKVGVQHLRIKTTWENDFDVTCGYFDGIRHKGCYIFGGETYGREDRRRDLPVVGLELWWRVPSAWPEDQVPVAVQRVKLGVEYRWLLDYSHQHPPSHYLGVVATWAIL